MTLAFSAPTRLQLRLPIIDWAAWRALGPDLPAVTGQPPELAGLQRAASATLAFGRGATALARVVLDTTAELSEPPGTRLRPVAPTLPAVERLLAESQALAALAVLMAEQAEALQALATALQPSPEAHLADWAATVEQFDHDHAGLAAQAEAWLTSGAPADAQPITAAHECALGEWCQGPGARAWGHLPTWAALAAPHADFHRALAQVAFAVRQGQSQAAHDQCRALQRAQAALSAALEALASDMLNSDYPPTLAGRLDPRGATPEAHVAQLSARFGLEALWPSL